MTHSDPQLIVAKLAKFMTEDPSCKQAALRLGNGVEIGLRVADSVECAFFKNATGAAFEVRAAKSPDVIFLLSVTAVEILASQTNRTLGELGVEVLKQYLGGEVHMKVPGNIFSIMKNGYLGIIKDAGIPFAKFLAENGVSSLTKIPDIIKKLKKH